LLPIYKKTAVSDSMDIVIDTVVILFNVSSIWYVSKWFKSFGTSVNSYIETNTQINNILLMM
jgi:hypothetical protein